MKRALAVMWIVLASQLALMLHDAIKAKDAGASIYLVIVLPIAIWFVIDNWKRIH
jgi:hypothetical protein